MKITIGEAVANEKGTATGGKPGDQTGRELRHTVYTNAEKLNFTMVYRFKNAKAADLCVRKLNLITDSNLVGYCQTEGHRTSLTDELAKYNWNVGNMIKTGKKTETDCSALAACCVKALQKIYGSSYDISKTAYSGNLGDILLSTKNFTYINIKALKSHPEQFKKGDALIRPFHHVAIITDISK